MPDDTNNYITIQTKSGMPAKDYSYFDEVLNILKPVLNQNNIKVLHIGQDSIPLSNTINLNNQTSINQSAYIICKSLCHLSVDSWSVHYACANEVPCVSLYGSTTIENHSPYHFNPQRTIFLESHRNGNKASFQREEQLKTIDLIYPELVAQSICKLLNIEFSYPFKTLYIGKSFSTKMLESDCTGVINTQQLGIQGLIMRLDFNFNLAILINQMQLCKVSIITNQPVPINILQQFKGQILELVYNVDKNHNPSFPQELINNGIKFNMFSELNEKNLNEIKLNYIDYGIIHQRKTMEILEELKNKDLNNIYYKSGKITLSNSGIYQSRWGMENGLKISSIFSEPQKLINKDLEKLWKEQEYFIFLEKMS